MERRITMKDVAREADVSLMTVSRVINEKDEVSDITRQRVLEIIDHMGYRPSSIARGLATHQTGTLGVVVPDIANPFFSSLVRGAENQAYAEGYNVFLCNTNEDLGREIAVLQSLEEKQVDGVLLCASRLEGEELTSLVKRLSSLSSVVMVLRPLDTKEDVGTVFIDETLGGQAATQHLLRGGHRAIGFVAGPPLSYSGRGRLSGYKAALSVADIPVREEWIVNCEPTVTSGQEAARTLLTDHPELTALLCFNDLVAVGVLQAANDLDRNVPADLAVVGFDDIMLAALVTPALTTCRIPQYKLGQHAMEMLLAQISDNSAQKSEVIFTPELIVRESAP